MQWWKSLNCHCRLMPFPILKCSTIWADSQESLHFSSLFCKNSICMKEVEVCTPTAPLQAEYFQNSPCILILFCYLAYNINKNLNRNAMRDGSCYIAIYFFNLFFSLIICYTISEIPCSWTQSFSCGTGFLPRHWINCRVKGLLYLSTFYLCGEFGRDLGQWQA